MLMRLDSVGVPSNDSEDARVHAGFGDLVLDTVAEQLRNFPTYSVVLTGMSAGL